MKYCRRVFPGICAAFSVAVFAAAVPLGYPWALGCTSARE